MDSFAPHTPYLTIKLTYYKVQTSIYNDINLMVIISCDTIKLCTEYSKVSMFWTKMFIYKLQ